MQFLLKHLRRRATQTVEVNGLSLSIYADDQGTVANLLRAGKIYEKGLVRLFEKHIKKGHTILDVGANIGYFTTQFSRLAGSEGRVIAFEPDRDNAKLLRRNCRNNKCRNVTIIEKAISNEVGETTLHLDKKYFGVHSLSRDNLATQGGSAAVKTTTLDAIVDSLGIRVDVVKMDTQGAEGTIVTHAKAVFSRPNILATLEFWPDGLRAMGTEPADLLQSIRAHGLSIGAVNKNGEIKLVLDSDLLNRPFGRYSSTNIIALDPKNFPDQAA